MTAQEIEILKNLITEEVYKIISEEDIDLDTKENNTQEKEVEHDSEASEAAPKRKRVVRKGKLRFKMTCPDGWSWDRYKSICVLPPRPVQIKRSRAAKRGNRKRRAFTARINKSRSKAMRKLRKPLKNKKT